MVANSTSYASEFGNSAKRWNQNFMQHNLFKIVFYFQVVTFKLNYCCKTKMFVILYCEGKMFHICKLVFVRMNFGERKHTTYAYVWTYIKFLSFKKYFRTTNNRFAVNLFPRIDLDKFVTLLFKTKCFRFDNLSTTIKMLL